MPSPTTPQLTAETSVPRGTPPVVLTFTELLCEAYRRHRCRTAIIDGPVTLTFGELEQRALALTAGLQEASVPAGERIVIVLPNGHEFFAHEHACYLGGWIRVALSPRLHAREIAEIADDCSARVIVIAEQDADRLASLSETALLITPGTAPRGEPSAAHVNTPRADDLMSLVYTSGTTGRPKGVMLSHSQWIPMCRNLMVDLPPIDERDVMLHVGPLSHLSGYIAGSFLFQGATQVIAPGFDAEATLQLIERHRVTILPAVPTMVNMMLPVAERLGGDYSSLRALFYGAAPMAPDRIARAVKLFGEVLIQGFGQSELGLPVTMMSARAHHLNPDGTAPAHLASAGRPTPWVRVRIVDDELQELPTGEVGEIYVRSESTMSGYWNKPAETATTVHQGWVLTGDVGRLDEDGYLYIVDRKKDMIVTGGYNVYPSEIENAISTIAEVAEVAVVGAPHEQWGETIVAAVVLRPGATCSEQTILDACSACLASYKKPRLIEFLDTLPKTTSGKIQRRALRERHWSDAERRVGG